MDLKAFQMLEYMNTRLSNIESNISRMDEKLEYSLALQRNQLIRIKNSEDIDDNMILMGSPYNDLNPQKSYKILNNPDKEFILLDVSSEDFKPRINFQNRIHIPLSDLGHRYVEIHSKTLPIMVISERGIKSIQACELLIKKGHYNINNISGGHAFLPETEATKPSTSPVS